MSRAKSGKVTKNKHKKILKLAKGYRGRSNNCFRIAVEKVEKALQYAYRDRKDRKRQFRALWIQRINAAARIHSLVYSQFMHGLKLVDIEIDRKVLSDLAISNPVSFAELASKAKEALELEARSKAAAA